MKRFVLMFFLAASSVGAQTATINWTNVHQYMDGFGGQTWQSADNLTSGQADLFFSPSAGIGLEYVRSANTSDGSIPDLVTLQEAIARGAKVELSLQSPPASLKYSGSFTDGTAGADGGCIATANFSSWATYIVNTINNYQSNGVPISVLSVQNEPNITTSSLGACIMTASLFDTFVGTYLGPALSGASLHPAVMLGEVSSWFSPDLVSTSLSDSTAAAYLTIVAGHGYGSSGPPDGTATGYCCNTASLYSTSKRVWQSEVNGGFTFNATAGLWNWDPSITDAMLWARNIHDYLTIADASGWEYWELADCCVGTSGSPFNDGLTDASFNPSKRMYAVGNWSKFVRSGYYRIDSTTNPQGNVYVSAFQDTPSGHLVIVALNSGGSSVSQTFSITNAPAFTSLIPYITSTSLNLVAQSTLTVSGNAFTYTLPAQSVTTFVGTGGGSFPWSGIISAARATDWSKAGVVGGIPSASWTQCGSTLPAGSSAATINAAIAACGTNQYALLGAGTTNLSAALTWNHKSNTVLRGSGANSTFLVIGSGVSTSCANGGEAICISSSDGSYPNGYTAINWTAGYSQGTTSITLASTAGITPNSTIIVLNQCDDGKTGSYLSCTGTSVDNGNFYNCQDKYATTPSGCSVNGGDSGNVTAGRGQSEMFYATAVVGNVVTLDHGLRNPNWNSARNPQAWIIQSVQYDGIEDMSIELAADTSITAGIAMNNAMNCWVSGVRMLHIPYTGIYGFDAIHLTIESNYIYQHNSMSGPPGADDFAVNFTQSGDNLVDNNIAQQVKGAFFDEGSSNGNVVAYNLRLNDSDTTNNFMWAAIQPHASGNNYHLDEGNVTGSSIYDEDYHGTHNFNTDFRNFSQGWVSNPTAPKNLNTNAFTTDAFNRYMNIVGNVMGTPGVHTQYKVAGASGEFTSPQTVLSLGQGNGGISPPVPGDPLGNCLAAATSMCYGNYDVVTGTVRWCGSVSNTGWSLTCGSVSEIATAPPSGLYANTVPTKGDTLAGQGAFPPSFYLPVKPPFWGAAPWPAIGPDISGGNVGICTGTLNTAGQYAGEASLSNSNCRSHGFTASAWAGHVNGIPAFICAMNVMGMPPDGSGGALSFNRTTCYGNSLPSSPTNLFIIVE